MKISVFGLGYVGTVTAACLARDGHFVIGVDVNSEKVDRIAAGRSPIVEPGVDDLLLQAHANGRLTATMDSSEAVIASDVSLVSVGTPPLPTGEADLAYVFGVCRQIGEASRLKETRHVVVIRSTVPPGTTMECHGIMCQIASDPTFHVAFNPEFLREGVAIADYDRPPYHVIGTEDEEAERVVREMYATVDAPVVVVCPSVAEMIKYVSNAWHATKVAFANEVGRIARSVGVDGREVMHIVAQDSKLNVSGAYMRPGFAYGGSCLPKDVAALLRLARSREVNVPLLSALPVTNSAHVEVAVAEVLSNGARRVVVLGLAFKHGTDDLRESPAVHLVKRLLGEGCEVSIFDRDVHRARLMGTNLAYIRQNLPHFERLLVEDPDDAVSDADVVVLTQGAAEFRDLLKCVSSETRVLDLAGAFTSPPQHLNYAGIAW